MARRYLERERERKEHYCYCCWDRKVKVLLTIVRDMRLQYRRFVEEIHELLQSHVPRVVAVPLVDGDEDGVDG